MEKVYQVINDCKRKYGDRFLYYLTGSHARNETAFNDYDISIVDTEDNQGDWADLLKRFIGVNDWKGRGLHAQINQYIPAVMEMSKQEYYDHRNMKVKRYYYSESNEKEMWNDAISLGNNLWGHESNLVSAKARDQGLVMGPLVCIQL